MSNTVAERPATLRPLVILLIGLPCIDLTLNVLWTEGIILNDAFVIGLMFGEFAFAIVLASMMGRAWVFSLLVTSWLLTAVTSMSVIWENRHQRIELVNSVLITIGAVPPTIFCGSLPFLLVRAIAGYRLSRAHESTSRESTKMEDFFVTTAVFAAMLVTVPATLALPDGSREYALPTMLMVGLIVCAGSVVILLPATVAYFAISTNILRLAVLVTLTLVLPFLMIALLNQLGVLTLSGTTLLEEFGPLLVTAAGCFSIGLIVMRATGFRWRRDVRPVDLAVGATLESDPLGNDEPLASDNRHRHRQLNRYAASALVLASVALVMTCSAVTRSRHAMDVRVEEIRKEWRWRGGSVDSYMHNVNGFQAPPGASMQDIQYLLELPQLTSIELAGTEVTDATLAKVRDRSSLQSLNFSDTQIGDAGLLLFNDSRNLGSIKLARSKVTARGLATFLANKNGHTLDLSGLGLTDADIAQLPLAKFNVLHLDDNPITNACLPYIRHATHAYLNRTRVDGSGLPLLSNVDYLEVDHTSLDDEQLQAFMELRPNLVGLSIRGTQVTDNCLSSIRKVSYLRIGDCQISPRGLLESNIDPSPWLSLNDRKYDGSLFIQKRWAIRDLDLSRSGITDKNIGALVNVAGLEKLFLCDCDVSDASLPVLYQLQLVAIDVTGTKISGEAAQKILGSTSVSILRSQCSDEVFEEVKHNDKWHFKSSLTEN